MIRVFFLTNLEWNMIISCVTIYHPSLFYNNYWPCIDRNHEIGVRIGRQPSANDLNVALYYHDRINHHQSNGTFSLFRAP
jgi:hypothetical protein